MKVKPDDVWAWHKMSVMLLRLNNYKDAELCNRQALSIIDFDAARGVQEELKRLTGGAITHFLKK